jgi:hypothetical protein
MSASHYKSAIGLKHFDHIYPNDFMSMEYYRPSDLTSEEEVFVKKYVDQLMKCILVDELEYVTLSYKYLLKTDKYSGSYDRMQTYYILVRTVEQMLNSTIKIQMATFNYIFHIPFNRNENYVDNSLIRHDILAMVVNHDLKSKDLSKLLKKNQFIYEIAWTCIINKLIAIREMVSTGLRLSLEFELRWGTFCEKECCKMPETFNLESYIDYV